MTFGSGKVYFHVRLGIDNLVALGFQPLKKSRIALCTNLSATDSRLMPTLAIISRQKNIKLKVIFVPEHGISGELQDQVGAADATHGDIPVISLYGKRLAPVPTMLKNIDTVVIDLIDIGTRYYTFLWTATMIMEQCAKLKKRILVLDRPNPLNGKTVQGPVLDPCFSSFVGRYPLPVRHGLTIAEAMNLVNMEHGMNAEIEVVKITGWKRKMLFNDTGLQWTAPSPNMPSFDTAAVYPGMCLLEGTNVSEGRGTTRPFEIFGAPWINSDRFVKAMMQEKIPGTIFRPVNFMPTFHKYKDRTCRGAHIHITDFAKFDPFTTGLMVIKSLHDMCPGRFRWRKPPYEFERKRLPFDILVGNAWIRKEVEKGTQVKAIERMWMKDLQAFKKLREMYLLYE